MEIETSPEIPWLSTTRLLAVREEIESTTSTENGKFPNAVSENLQRDGEDSQGNVVKQKSAISVADRQKYAYNLAIEGNSSERDECDIDLKDDGVEASNLSDSDATYCSLAQPEETVMKALEETGLFEEGEMSSSNTWKSPSLLCDYTYMSCEEKEDFENFKHSDNSETRVVNQINHDSISNEVHTTKVQCDAATFADCFNYSNGLQYTEGSHTRLKEESLSLNDSSLVIVQTNNETDKEQDQGGVARLPLPSFSVISGGKDFSWQNSEVDHAAATTTECNELLSEQFISESALEDKLSGCKLRCLSPDPFSDLLFQFPLVDLGKRWKGDKSVIDSFCTYSSRNKVSPRKKDNILYSGHSKASSGLLVESETKDLTFTPFQEEKVIGAPNRDCSTALHTPEVYDQAVEGQNICPKEEALSSVAPLQQHTSITYNQLLNLQVSPKFLAQAPSKPLQEIPSEVAVSLPLSSSTPSPTEQEVSFDLETQENSPIISQDAIFKAIEMISTPSYQNAISCLLKYIDSYEDDGKGECVDSHEPSRKDKILSGLQGYTPMQMEKAITIPGLQLVVPSSRTLSELVSIEVNSINSESTSVNISLNDVLPEKCDANKENIQSEDMGYNNLDSNNVFCGANASKSHHVRTIIGHECMLTDVPGLLQKENRQTLSEVMCSSSNSGILHGQDMTPTLDPISGCFSRKKKQSHNRQTCAQLRPHRKYGLPPVSTRRITNFSSAVARMVWRLQKISSDIYKQVLTKRDLRAIQEELRTASSVIYRLYNGLVYLNKTKTWTKLEEVKQVCEKLIIKVGQLLRQCQKNRRGTVTKYTKGRIVLAHQLGTAFGSEVGVRSKPRFTRRGRKKKEQASITSHTTMMLPMGTDLEIQEMELDKVSPAEEIALVESSNFGNRGSQEEMEVEESDCLDSSTAEICLKAPEKVIVNMEGQERKASSLDSRDQESHKDEGEEMEMDTEGSACVDSIASEKQLWVGGLEDLEHNSTQGNESKSSTEEEPVTDIESLTEEPEGSTSQREMIAQELPSEQASKGNDEINNTAEHTADTSIPCFKDSSEFENTVRGSQDVPCQLSARDVLDSSGAYRAPHYVTTVTSTSYGCSQTQLNDPHSCGPLDLQNVDSRTFNESRSPERSHQSDRSIGERGAVPAKSLSLVRMLEVGIIEPGSRLLSTQQEGKDYYASIMPNGTLESADGLFFTTPQAWLQALTKKYKKKEQAFRKVVYKGTTLYDIASSIYAKQERSRANKVMYTVQGRRGGDVHGQEIDGKRKMGFCCVSSVSGEEIPKLKRSQGGNGQISSGLGRTCRSLGELANFIRFDGNVAKAQDNQNPFLRFPDKERCRCHRALCNPGTECKCHKGCYFNAGKGSDPCGESHEAVSCHSLASSEDREGDGGSSSLQMCPAFPPKLSFRNGSNQDVSVADRGNISALSSTGNGLSIRGVRSERPSSAVFWGRSLRAIKRLLLDVEIANKGKFNSASKELWKNEKGGEERVI